MKERLFFVFAKITVNFPQTNLMAGESCFGLECYKMLSLVHSGFVTTAVAHILLMQNCTFRCFVKSVSDRSCKKRCTKNMVAARWRNEVLKVLQKFGERVISRRSSDICPAQAPSLKPVNFWFSDIPHRKSIDRNLLFFLIYRKAQTHTEIFVRENNTEPISVKEYGRHIFGAKSSPTCVNYALQQVA